MPAAVYLNEKIAHELYIERMTTCVYKVWFNREHVDTVRGQRAKAIRRASTIAINALASPERIMTAYKRFFGKEARNQIVGGRWLLLEILEKAGYAGTAKLLIEQEKQQ